MNASRRLTCLALPALLLACAPAAVVTTDADALADAAPRQRYDSTHLTQADLRAATQTDAYAIVQALRPRWLRQRGVDSLRRPSVVRVYLDGLSMGGVEALRAINRDAIQSMEFLDGLTATQRWGLDHGSGAILVTTRKGG